MHRKLVRKLNRLWIRRHFGNDKNQRVFDEYHQVRKKLIEELPRSTDNPILPIKELDKNSSKQDIKQQIQQGEPFIIRGYATDWNAIKTWDFDHFIERYGHVKVPLIDAISEVGKKDHRMGYEPLGAILTQIREGKSKAYPRFLNLLNEFKELRDDVDTEDLIQLRSRFGFQKFYQLFIGYEGSRSMMHAGADHNFFIQVYGRKKWVLYAPKYNHFLNPNIDRTPYFTCDYDVYNPSQNDYDFMNHVPRYEFELEPGDFLFNPALYWHDVSNLTPTIGVAFRWYHAMDSIKSDLVKTFLSIFSYNPPVWSIMRYRTDGLKYYLKKQGILD